MPHVERYHRLDQLVRLGATLCIVAATPLLGCQDPPLSTARAERLVAADSEALTAVRWADDLSAGPESEAAITVSDGFVAADGFEIDDLTTSQSSVVGAERFTVRVVLTSPKGESLKGYGLKTPYEEGIHAFAALPMAVRNGEVQIKVDPFSTMPKRGKYPFEFWLLNDRHEASNRLQGEVTVQ